MERLNGKVIVIAGGAGGIGTGISRRYAAEGARVVIGDIDLDDAGRVADSINAAGGTAAAEHVDIRDDASVRRLVARAEELHGGIDGMHANAAAVQPGDGDVVGTSPESLDRSLALNAAGHAACARHAVPALLRRGGGTILFTSSAAAIAGQETRIGYSMAKAAVHALMRHVATVWGREGIRANVIAPGVIVTAKMRELSPDLIPFGLKRVKLAHLGEPDDIAAMAALLMSDDGRYITGQVISVDGGATMRS